jgi:hypothetical protein
MSRRTGLRSYLSVNGRDVHVPKISSKYNEYRCIGIRIRSLVDLQRAADARLTIVHIDTMMGDRWALDYESASWIRVSETTLPNHQSRREESI